MPKWIKKLGDILAGAAALVGITQATREQIARDAEARKAQDDARTDRQ